MQFLGKIGNLMFLNMLFLVSCIPIVTIGTALAAMHKVTQAIAMGDEPYIVRTFLRGFRQNFKIATIVWLVILVFVGVIVVNFLVTVTYLAGGAALVCQWLLLFVFAVILAISSYLFPLIARYENTLKGYLLNASILAIAKLPHTLLLTVLSAAPFTVLGCAIGVISKILIFWVLIGFALISFLQSLLLCPICRDYEKTGKKPRTNNSSDIR